MAFVLSLYRHVLYLHVFKGYICVSVHVGDTKNTIAQIATAKPTSYLVTNKTIQPT